MASGEHRRPGGAGLPRNGQRLLEMCACGVHLVLGGMKGTESDQRARQSGLDAQTPKAIDRGTQYATPYLDLADPRGMLPEEPVAVPHARAIADRLRQSARLLQQLTGGALR